MPGTLFLVSTPIGNLEDLTHRAVRVLSSVAAIACEDTRQTRKLLAHYGIRTPTLSYHEHNETSRTPELIGRLLAGDDVALVSDAGTPLVSDPGSVLVARAAQEGIRVVPIPGPSALLAALAASGLAAGVFQFVGFLPSRRSQRRKLIEKLRDVSMTVVAFEAPHRILETLAEAAELLGERPMAAARELTKVHEEILRGTAAGIRDELATRNAVKGEFTLVFGPAPEAVPQEVAPDEVRSRVRALIAQGTDRMEAIKTVARALKVPKREVYRMIEE